MDAVPLAVSAAGAAIALAALLDAFLTVAHPDVDGPLTKALQRSLWTGVVIPLTRRAGRTRRQVLAAAGPVMILLSVAMWFGLLVLGAALLAWPHMPGGVHVRGDLGALGFLDALYYSGITATTLGYGDVTPTTPFLQALAVLESAAGFGLLTTTLTYLLGVLNGIAERDVLSLRVVGLTDGTGDGVKFVIDAFEIEPVEHVRDRLEALTESLRRLQERLHRFPILAFYYRSKDPAHDPEPMLRAASEAAIASRLLLCDERYGGLRLAVNHLDASLTHFMATIAGQYLRRDAVAAIDRPVAREEDVRVVERVRERLVESGTCRPREAHARDVERALHLAVRTRAFLDALDRLTGWRLSDRRAEGGTRSAAEVD